MRVPEKRFQTLVPISSGSTARVYRAFDPERGENVALKRLLINDPGIVTRFRREAEIQAGLDHPHICPVYGLANAEDGRLLICMRLIDGSTFADLLPTLDTQTVVALLLQVCDAIDYAHGSGVVHRDLKPTNIMVEKTDSGWHAWVCDFGLAWHEDQATLTAAGDIMGTPAYMAPEQARGDLDSVGPAADVFALGCILYECLAGKPPFVGATPAETIDNLLHKDATSPKRLNPFASEELCRIALQCLEESPDRRYGSVKALTADLERASGGEKIQARRYSLTYRLQQRWRRHPWIGSFAVLTTLALLSLLVSLAWTANQGQVRERAALRFAADLGTIQSSFDIARMAPLHDIGVDRTRLLDGIEEITRQTPETTAVQQMMNATLAQAYLSLDDFDQALDAANLALVDDSSGTATAAAREARVASLMGLYTQRATALRGLPLDRREELLSAEIDRWLVPAEKDMQLLQGSLPILPAVRLALARDDYSEARSLIDKVAADVTYPYDHLLATGEWAMSQADHEAQIGNAAAALQLLSQAKAAYMRASNIGRSDPRPRLGSCFVAQRMNRLEPVDPPPDSLDALDSGCLELAIVDPGRASSWSARAGAYSTMASTMDQANRLDEARQLLAQGSEEVRRALTANPDDLVALDFASRIELRLGGLSAETFEAGDEHLKKALDYVTHLRAVYPDYLPGAILEGEIHRDRGRQLTMFQKDPSAAFMAADNAFHAAAALQPDALAVKVEHSLNDFFRFYRARSESVEEALRLARSGILRLDEVIAQDPDNVDALFNQGANYGDLWFYLIALDDPPEVEDLPALKELALDYLSRVQEQAPERSDGYSQSLMLLLSSAEFHIEQGRPADNDLARAHSIAGQAARSGVRLTREMSTWLAVTEVKAALLAGDGVAQALERAWTSVETAEPDSIDAFYHRLWQIELAGLDARYQRHTGIRPTERTAAHILRIGRENLDALIALDRSHGIVLCPGARVLIEQFLLDTAPNAEDVNNARQYLDRCIEESPDYIARYAEDAAILNDISGSQSQ